MNETTEGFVGGSAGETVEHATISQADAEMIADAFQTDQASVSEILAEEVIAGIDPPDAEKPVDWSTIITLGGTYMGRDRNLILQTLLGRAVGETLWLGELAGIVDMIEEHAGQVFQGKELPPSVWLNGTFEAVLYATGEVVTSGVCILNRAAGTLIKSAFASGAVRAELDLRIGVTNTGRSIPFEYRITSFIQSEAQRQLQAIRKRQQARLPAAARKLLAASPSLYGRMAAGGPQGVVGAARPDNGGTIIDAG